MTAKAPDEAGLVWLGALAGVGLAVGAVALAALGTASRRTNPRTAAPKGDDMATTRNILGPVWPIPLSRLRRVGESVLARRAGSGRPHKGVDLFADADTPVLSAVYGRVLRVVDGRTADRLKDESLWRAGLFVDVRGIDRRIYRYLHLGSHAVTAGQPIRAGDPIGTVSPSGHSGVEHSEPHVHFEIRAGDFDRDRRVYGEPIDPLVVLPPRRKVA